MPSARHYFVKDTAVFVSSRMQEGLPLVPTNFMNSILWSILAKAHMLYPQIHICGFIFLLNHFHFLFVVENPEHVSAYVGYVKQEIAHAVNLLLGRKRKTIWENEFDAPVVLDSTTLLNVLAYLYTNPVAAGYVETIDDYQGVSSFQMLKNDSPYTWRPTFARSSIPLLHDPKHPDREDTIQTNRLIESSNLSCRLDVSLFAWKRCFDDTMLVPDSELKKELMNRIRQKELELSKEREEKNIGVMGASKLRSSSMLYEYTPEKHANKQICLSSDKKIKVEFITFFKALCKKAKDVYEKWKLCDFSEPYPPGLFMPPRPRTQNVLLWRYGLDTTKPAWGWF